MRSRFIGVLGFVFLLISGCYSQSNSPDNKKIMDNTKKESMSELKVDKSNEEWKKVLSPEVYRVARQAGTERPGSSKYNRFKEVGTYYCAVCGNPLFKSDAKFESSCGWPSFFEPITKNSVIYRDDNTFGMHRIEVLCGRCDSHLGHVFDDGPPPTHQRYCMNGVVLDFKKATAAAENYNEKSKG